ncbi:MAG: hypothetical protein INR73_09070 [Williamsia sp.]|nr:hypothetical protein [Williamsia sp.]
MKRIEKVSSSRQLKLFIDFVHDLYKEDPNYVPELFIAQRDLLTPGKHPFHEHSTLQLFLAYEGDKIIGRIAAILNNNYNAFNGVQEGFFGFFDCINDQATADLLLNEATSWVKQKGATKILGPVNPSTNETCGMLIEGFDSPPVVMMTYNAAYYPALVEQAGFAKNVDLIAYKLTTADYTDQRLQNITEALKKRLSSRNITFRPVDLKNFKEEVAKLREIYNSAWDKNLGFVPMTEKEFAYMAKDLKLILDKDFCMVAEHEGKIVGFSLAIPDINQIQRTVKRGRLLPTGIFKLLFGRKKINNLRVLALGIVEGYRKTGIDMYFYRSIIENGIRKNFISAEASWILEHNVPMNKAMISINGKPYKKYRIYEKTT